MRERTQEQLYASLQRGMQAATDLSVAKPILEQQKQDLVADAIRRFRSMAQPYTDREAMLFVAALVANQDIIDKLDNMDRDGRRAAERLQNVHLQTRRPQ